MIRLRYVLVAVIVLALVPWALDGLPSLACAIPTVECLDESPAVVSDGTATVFSNDVPAVRSNPVDVRSDMAPGTPASLLRSPPVQDVGGANASRDAVPPAPGNDVSFSATRGTDQSDAGKTLGTADVDVDYVIGLAVGNFALAATSGLVSVNWTASQEAGVVRYVLDRKLEGAASYDLDVEVGYPQGDGTAYSLYDDPHGAGTFIYRLRATLSNGTERILAEGGVTL